jgi:uncharacterized protein YjdB
MKLQSLRRAAALLLALALACALLVVPAAADDPDIPLVSLSLSDATKSSNSNTAVFAQISPSDATTPITWRIEGTQHVYFQNNQNTGPSVVLTILAEAAGETFTLIAESDNGLSDSCQITVKADPSVPQPADVQSVTLNRSTLTLKVNETATLTATVNPSTANQDVIWTSSSSAVSVDQDGNITALAPGQANIVATSAANSQRRAICTVTVEDPPSPVTAVRLSESSVNITQNVIPGGSVTLTATVEPANATDRSLTWSSSDTKVRVLANTDSRSAVVSVPSNTPVGTHATITVTARSNPAIQALCFVQVVAAPPPEITAVAISNPSTDPYRYVDPGKTITLNASITPSEIQDPEISWSSADTSVARVRSNGDLSATVTGVSVGKTEITVRAGGSEVSPDAREIEVSGILLSYLKRSTSGGKGTTVNLTEGSVVDLYQYQDISVTPQLFGNARNKSVTWESSNNSVAQVVSGRVTASYPGDAVITASVAGTGFNASFKVHVSEDVADAITVNMGSSPSYSLSGILSQLNARSQSKAGAPLDCVYNLKVSTKNGVLYYRYTSPETPGHGVGGTERYYYQPSGQGQMALRDVTFVPLPGFDGTAVVDYNAMTTTGSTFTGTIRIEAASSGDVNYATEAGQPVSFAAEHFSAICMGRNGRAIRYVTFSLPSSGRGTLYYNYSPTGQYSQKVTSSTRYYATSSPSIDSITFVPASGYVGNVEIPYHCVDSTGASYNGTVTVRVYGGSGSGGGNVEYSTAQNRQRALNANDFNDASLRATGASLESIRFTSLPSSSAGTLYLNYTNSSSTKVTTAGNYYRSSSPRISNITFVPAANYNGTVTIPFTATNANRATFSGSLIIHVGSGTGTVHYNTSRNQSVALSAWDFNDASRRITGQTLDYIRFNSLPSSGAGVLYYNYASASSTGSRVTVNTDYRRNGAPSLSNITFVPAAGYTGTVSIPFTGYDDSGVRFDGTLTVTVEGGTSTPAVYNILYTGSSTPVAFRAGDFQNVCQTVLGNPLSYVQFSSLPTTGRLYLNYSLSSRTGTPVSTSTRYGVQELGQISYVPRAEYQGTLTIPYTLYDVQGARHSSSVEIQISNGYCYSSFNDTASGWDWAKPSIEYLRASGITNGYSNNTYRPGQSISRGEFTLMICRAFRFPTTGSSSFPDVPAGSTYAGAISSAKNLGIVQGNNGRFQPDRPITRQSAMTMICRAMEAAGQSLPAADTGLLSSYTDGNRVSAFARPSVAALVQMGAVRGNSAMRLNPGTAISRAEMAVILHRVLAR